MQKLIAGLLLAAAFPTASHASAEFNEQIIRELVNSTPTQLPEIIKDITESTATLDTDTYDVLAEVIQQPAFSTPKIWAWSCLALGNSNNPRYKLVIWGNLEKAEGVSKSATRHCREGLAKVDGVTPTYTIGSVDLTKLRDKYRPERSCPDSTKQQLLLIKQLFDEGHITESVYKNKQSQIVREL
ncbi:MAG TPA: hypothetical protein VIN71_02770 [Pseudomonadales bacterium]